MNTPSFPKYNSAAQAANWGCWHCSKTLDPAKMTDAGYPPGRGQYTIRCDSCQHYKFFDLINQE
jgi:hypothetical protein